MARIVWTRRALTRIREIRAYIREFDPHAALYIASRLLDAGNSLTDFPYRGRAVDGNLRELPSVRPYIVIYEVVGDTVYIVTIRHSAQYTPEA